MVSRLLIPVTAGGAAVVALVALIALTLRQPDIQTHAPTLSALAEARGALVGPILYTVDATSPDAWRYFSFRSGVVFDNAGPTDWDLAFRRYQVIANGGPAFVGQGGILDLGPVRFEDVRVVPATGYHGNEGMQDARNPAIAAWYHYGFFTHVLSPKPHVWAVRTAIGRYAKMEIVSYYCPGSRPGCFTFRYVYQDGGSTLVDRP